MNNPYRFKWWALLGVSLLAFTAFLDFTIVNTALPFIQAAFHVDILQLQWVANIFPIILSMTMIAIGKVSDLWDTKKVFYLGISIFGVAALGAGLSSSIEMLIFFRGLQALGASIIFIVSAALISHVFPEKDCVKAISIYGGVTGFGMMIGPFLGGILIGLLGWKWVFWVNLPLIALGLSFCSFSLGNAVHEKHTVKVDWIGLCLLVFGLGSVMYGIIEGASSDWASLKGWGFLVSGVLSLVALIILDEFSKHPLLDLKIFQKKLIVLATLSCAMAGIVSYVFMFFDPLYLRILREQSAYTIGLLIAVIPAAQALISFVFNRMIKWFGLPNILLISLGSGFLSVILHRTIELHTSLYFLPIPFFLLGVNWGLSNAAMISSVNEVIAPSKIGEAIGTIATIWNVTGALFLAISTAIFHGSKDPFLQAFHRVIDFNFIMTAILFFAALFICLKLRFSSKKA
jgi:EmrB/QacA subfamily drug resistance transporter